VNKLVSTVYSPNKNHHFGEVIGGQIFLFEF